ncbi:MAG: hypothetical protein AAGF11_14120 [Myxococcota bacterium]
MDSAEFSAAHATPDRTAVVLGVPAKSRAQLEGKLHAHGYSMLDFFPPGVLRRKDLVILNPPYESPTLFRHAIETARERAGEDVPVILLGEDESFSDPPAIYIVKKRITNIVNAIVEISKQSLLSRSR